MRDADCPDTYGPHILSATYGYVDLRARRTGTTDIYASFSRAAFIAAVETECGVRCVPADAIVIERAELPVVATDVPGFGPHYALVKDGPIHESSFTYAYPAAPSSSAAWHRRTAEAHLALAEYLAAHPPVPPVSDEDVETLAGLLGQVNPGSVTTARTARRLLATGRVSVTK
jgi:hypothetical protein